MIMATLVLAASAANADCGAPTVNASGGDYTNPADRQKLTVVETFHFTPEVEHLKRGLSGRIGGDIGYTLEHFPNHHRALAAMARLAIRDKKPQPLGARYSADCYFERAIKFKGDDAAVRSVYASYLIAQGRTDAALAQLAEAARLQPENATTQYNLGLLYFKKQDYGNARMHARKAYDKGFPLPGLKVKLVDAGAWDEK